MRDTFKFGVDLLDNPRYESKPTQPKDPGEMSLEEEHELLEATLERDDVAASVWEAIFDEITPAQAKEIVVVLFRDGKNHVADFTEAGRLMYKFSHSRVDALVESETHNTDMSKD